MALFPHGFFRRSVAMAILAPLLWFSSGCAYYLGRTSETVTIVTTPAGRSVFYEGVRFSDGDTITVQTDSEPPQFNVGEANRPIMVDMSFDPDVGPIVGDAVWLLFGILPGLIAFGVDFGTGAWRDLDAVQRVNVPDSSASRSDSPARQPAVRRPIEP